MTQNNGIMIFKDTMEYLVNGLITAEQYAELTKMIYNARWNGVEYADSDIDDKMVLLIWKTLKHSVQKSARNSRYYSKSNEITPSTEFDIEPSCGTFQAQEGPIKTEVEEVIEEPVKEPVKASFEPDEKVFRTVEKPTNVYQHFRSDNEAFTKWQRAKSGADDPDWVVQKWCMENGRLTDRIELLRALKCVC